MNTETIQNFTKEAYENSLQKGFHEEKHSDEHYLALIITELSEMVEAHRKDKRCKWDAEQFNKLSNLTDKIVFAKAFEFGIKDTYEDEMADVMIRTFDLAGLRNITLKSVEDSYKDLLKGIKIDITPDEMIEDSLRHLFHFTATEFLYETVTEYIGKSSLRDTLQDLVERILLWARLHEIDLERHIRLKMRYNSTRPPLHGKKY